MKQVTDHEYRAFIVRHLGHINITGTLGAIQWVHSNIKDYVMATKRNTEKGIIYEVLIHD